jgi:hypothetical protein
VPTKLNLVKQCITKEKGDILLLESGFEPELEPGLEPGLESGLEPGLESGLDQKNAKIRGIAITRARGERAWKRQYIERPHP